MSITRRQFLTGVGAAGLIAAGSSLTACTSPTPPANNPVNDTGVPVGNADTSELISTAYLNPQDYDYRQNTTDFKTLFSPLKIGSLSLNNRIFKSAAGSATYLAGLTDELLQYYVQFAKGGVELIWVEMIGALEPPADGSPISAEAIEFGKKLVAECGKYGAKLGYQTYGFSAKSTNELTKEEIIAYQEKYANTAKCLKDMGFVAFEINAAGFNLGAHFLSRYHNTRTDEYGVGSIENRARFVTECIQKIKQVCGKELYRRE